MNFLIYGVIAVVFFGSGWLLGVRNISNIEKLTNDLEQAAEYIENVDTSNIDEVNIIINDNRDTNALFRIHMLQNIEEENLTKAKEMLVIGLSSDYDDIKEDEFHGISTERSQDIVHKIEELSGTQPIYKKIIESSSKVR